MFIKILSKAGIEKCELEITTQLSTSLKHGTLIFNNA